MYNKTLERYKKLVSPSTTLNMDSYPHGTASVVVTVSGGISSSELDRIISSPQVTIAIEKEIRWYFQQRLTELSAQMQEDLAELQSEGK